MEKIKLAMDLDDTIANTTEEWLKRASSDLNRKIGKDELREYEIERVLDVDEAYVSATYAKVWANAQEIKLLDKDIPRIVSRLRGIFDIIIVTASPGSEKDITGWLLSNGIHYDRLVKVEHAKEKAELGAKLGIPIFIDDSPKVAKAVLDDGRYVVMIRQPWNARFITESSSERLAPANSWAEASVKLEWVAGLLASQGMEHEGIGKV